MSSSEKPPSLQKRLTLGLALALGLVLTLMSAVIDYLVDRELHAYMDARLLSHANGIVSIIGTHPEQFDTLHLLMPEYNWPTHTDFFEIRDAAGVSVFRSESSAAGELTPPPVWPDAAPLYYDLRLPDGHLGRALALPLNVNFQGESGRFTLIVARERDFEERLETGIDLALYGGAALALTLILVIARWAVRRSLAPVLRAGARIAPGDGALPSADALRDPALPLELQPFTRALNAAFARLHDAIEREHRFSLNVAHELRTPVAEIRAAVEVAARLPSDAQARQAAFAACLNAAARMQRAIDTLLLLARHEAGQARLAPDPLDLSALLDNLLTALAPLAAPRDIRFERAYGPGMWLRSDQGALERIVSNLLHNAITYAPAGSAVAVRVEAGITSLALTVDNLAPDLAPDDLPLMGERFWRKSSGGGTAANTGLGLALTLALARSLRLDIDFTLSAGRLTVRVSGLARL